MKIALVHDYLREWGGAEEVLKALHELYPDAPIYTAYMTKAIQSQLGSKADPRLRSDDTKSWRVITSPLQRLFAIGNKTHGLTPLLPWAFSRFDFSQYDVVISSSSAFAKSIKTKHPTTHICYCHTVPRFLYGFSRERRQSFYLDAVEKPLLNPLRRVDQSSAKRVDYFIANSQVVADRIKSIYQKDATVIYPPVDIEKFEIRNPKFETKIVMQNPKDKESLEVGVFDKSKDLSTPLHSAQDGKNAPYFVIIGRLSPIKHYELAIEACNKLNINLKIIGTGSAEAFLKSIAGQTVEFLGRLSDEDAAPIIQNTQAAIFTAQDEDFGMGPIEILGAGKPVVAFASPAAKETLIDGTTGPFFSEPHVDVLARVLANFDPQRYDAATLRNHAQQFSKERFEKEMRAFVESHAKQ